MLSAVWYHILSSGCNPSSVAEDMKFETGREKIIILWFNHCLLILFRRSS